MKNVGRASGAVVGAIIGAVIGLFFLGAGAIYGAALGAMVGGMIGGIIDNALAPTIFGPKLDTLITQTATYGAFIPRIYGKITLLGNVFWLKNNELLEERVVTGGGFMGALTGKPKQVIYNYYASFAVGLCEGPIVGIARMWIGPLLIYNIETEDEETLLASYKFSKYFLLHLGTDTQLPDPVMQTSLGVDFTPAYRGLSYLVFDKLLLKRWQNSLVAAQVKPEIVTKGTLHKELRIKSVNHNAGLVEPQFAAFTKDYIFVTNTGIYHDRLVALSRSNASAPIYVSTLEMTNMGPDEIIINGRYAYIACYLSELIQVVDISDPFHMRFVRQIPINAIPIRMRFENSTLYVGCRKYSWRNSANLVIITPDLGEGSNDVVNSYTSYSNSEPALAVKGNYVYLVHPWAMEVYNVLDSNNPQLVTTLTIDNVGVGLEIWENYIYLLSDTAIRSIDISDLENPVYASPSVNLSGATYGAARDIKIKKYFDEKRVFAYVASVFSGLDIFDITDPLEIKPFISQAGLVDAHRVYPDGDYIYMLDNQGNNIAVYVLLDPIIVPELIPLYDIVKPETLQSHLLTSEDVDATELWDLVRGYRIAQLGAIRPGLEPLRAAWPFDCVQHGYIIKYKRRGSASVASIPASALDARKAKQAPGVQVINVREMDSMLPKKLTVTYFDVDREYDIGEQYEERINTDTANVTTVELAIAFSSNEAKQKAQMLLYLYWMERYTVNVKLPPPYDYLESCDVVTVLANEANYQLRLTTVNFTSDGRVECQAKYNEAAIYIPPEVDSGAIGQQPAQVIRPEGVTKYELLDIPMLTDAYNRPGYPIAMSGVQAAWRGGYLYKSLDGGITYDLLATVTAPASTMGYCLSALGQSDGGLLDKSGLLSVIIYQGTLSSVTEAQVFSGSNWFAYGFDERWEIIGVQNCVLQEDGSYILSDFLRGQFGTEWTTGLHGIDDKIIHLSIAELDFLSVNWASIGVEGLFRGVSFNSEIDSDIDRAFTYWGVNLKCYSPCHATGDIHPSSNDWLIFWTRRSRYVGWRDLVDAQLGEVTEGYEIDVYKNSAFTQVMRTISATIQSANYTSAQQIADFGSYQTSLHLKIYQLSATVGRGYPLTISITR